MKTMKHILDSENIHTASELRSYADQHYPDQSKIPFKILRATDLMLDSEDRIYDDKVKYEQVIFDIPRLRIANASDISFINCIFFGELCIGQSIRGPVKIYLDYCALACPISISGIEAAPSVTLQSVNCPELRISTSEIRKLDICSCSIAIFSMDECKVFEFFTSSNVIQYLSIGRSTFEKVSFDHAQLCISEQPPQHHPGKLKRLVSDFKFLWFGESLDFEEAAKRQHRAERNETFRFLLSHSDIKLSREAYGQIRYLEALSSVSNPALRLIYIACGALLKPSRILAWLVVTIVFFAFLFHLPIFQFNAPGQPGEVCRRSLDWAEAFYFSGVSFTTIGYGDIVPVGWVRVAAVAEGLTGVILASSFLVSLTRKYLD